MTSVASATTYRVRLGFAPESIVIDDPDHPGLRRAGPRAQAPYAGENVELRSCEATDGLANGVAEPELLRSGFAAVDLSGLEAVQRTCADVRQAGRVDASQAAAIRTAFDGAVLPTTSGDALRVLYLADEGFIMRTGGPNGMALVGPRSSGMNDHGSAVSVHADQDVFGTPLTQLMDGRAPELFVHDSPEARNLDADLHLLNVWIPLQQITQPLVLADGRSVDRRRHQLRYGLATDSFLERGDDMVINDIWLFLHDEAQEWYFRSEMDHRHAYVFNTLSTPHGAGVLPGEDLAEWCYRVLEAAEAAAEQRDVAALTGALGTTARPNTPHDMTPPLADAVAAMSALVDVAAADPAAVCGERSAEWVTAARTARRRVVRMSLEMRMVVTIAR